MQTEDDEISVIRPKKDKSSTNDAVQKTSIKQKREALDDLRVDEDSDVNVKKVNVNDKAKPLKVKP